MNLRPQALPHKRKAKNRTEYRAYYTDQSAEWVANHFKTDIDMFGYRFDA